MAAAAVALLSCLAWFGIHERSVEHKKDVAVATAAVARVTKADAAIETKANTEIQHDQVIYKQVISLPPVGDLGIVCSSPGGDAVPSTTSGTTSGDGDAARAGGSSFDPSGEALTVGRNADAEIIALQHIIVDLRNEMAAAHEVHR